MLVLFIFYNFKSSELNGNILFTQSYRCFNKNKGFIVLLGLFRATFLVSSRDNKLEGSFTPPSPSSCPHIDPLN